MYQERLEAEVEVNIYIDIHVCVCVCMYVSVKIGQNHTFSLFFGIIDQISAIHVFYYFSARQVSAAQAQHWREARHSKTKPTLNPQWAKSFRKGNLALWQIRYFQSTQATMLLIRKLPLARLVREIAQDYKTDLRFTTISILALHHAAEYILVEVMQKTHTAAIHHRCITIAPKDMHLVKAITHVW